MTYENFESCIKACQSCAAECERCISECLKEEHLKKMVRCIQLDLDCASICSSTAEMMARGSEFAKKISALCVEICQSCGDECKKFPQMEHCIRCAEACYHCAEECKKITKAA